MTTPNTATGRALLGLPTVHERLAATEQSLLAAILAIEAEARALDVERLARALAQCIGYLHMESPTLGGSYWPDRAAAIVAAYEKEQP